MPRYSLRNQDKIANHYDRDYLKRMLDSLAVYFKANKIEVIQIDGDCYPVIFVSDCGHTVNDFVFYIISKHYDVYNLAFKEVIG
jgi:hypothetical protein